MRKSHQNDNLLPLCKYGRKDARVARACQPLQQDLSQCESEISIQRPLKQLCKNVLPELYQEEEKKRKSKLARRINKLRHITGTLNIFPKGAHCDFHHNGLVNPVTIKELRASGTYDVQVW